MKKYKLCPSCGTRNAPAVFECKNCEADLTMVKITDEETEKTKRMPAGYAAEQPSAAKRIRVCECGAVNPSNARKCSVCGEDISDITPINSIKEKGEGQGEQKDQKDRDYVFASLDGGYSYKVAAGEVILGRENAMGGYLSGKPYVSRAHARLSLGEDGLYIENLSGTNYTYVNDRKITERTKLQDGDEVGLGGANVNGRRQDQAAYFQVRIGQCM